MKVKVEDRSRVKDVKFEYPDLMNDNARDLIIKEYHDILDTELSLDVARNSVRYLERRLKEQKEKFESIKKLFTLEFEEKEIEQVERTTVNMSVVNPTDASNRNYNS